MLEGVDHQPHLPAARSRPGLGDERHGGSWPTVFRKFGAGKPLMNSTLSPRDSPLMTSNMSNR